MVRLRRVVSVPVVVMAGAALVVAGPAAASQAFQLGPGQRQCVNARITAVPGDHLYTQVDHSGSASAPVQWTRWSDIVDGTDGFANAALAEQSVTDRTAQNFSEQVDETDGGDYQKDVWFCAKNRGTSTVSATLAIATRSLAAPVWILTRTGNTSYWAHGQLPVGQQACAGGGGRHANIEAVIGERSVLVIASNSGTSNVQPTTTYASIGIDSSQPGGFPEGLTGCVRNLDALPVNFQFWFSYS